MADLRDPEYLKELLQAQKEQEDLARSELMGRLENYTPVVDWTPLAAQLDAMAGGDVAQQAAKSSLARGLESEKRMNELVGQKKVRDQMMNDLLKQEKIDARAKRSHEARLSADIRKSKLKVDTEAANMEQDYKVLESAFTPKANGRYDLKKIESSLSNYARSVGGEKGALAEGDVNRAMYLADIPIIIEKLKKKFGDDAADIPYEAIKPYIEQLQSSKIGRANSLRSRIDALRQGFAEDPTYEHMFTGDGYGDKAFSQSYKTLEQASALKPLLRQEKAEPAKAAQAPAVKAVQAPKGKTLSFEELKAQVQKAKQQ